jgi:hypothetical protein
MACSAMKMQQQQEQQQQQLTCGMWFSSLSKTHS